MTDSTSKRKRRIFNALAGSPNVWPPLRVPLLSFSGDVIGHTKITDWSLSVRVNNDMIFFCDECDASLLIKGVVQRGQIVCVHGNWTRDQP